MKYEVLIIEILYLYGANLLIPFFFFFFFFFSRQQIKLLLLFSWYRTFGLTFVSIEIPSRNNFKLFDFYLQNALYSCGQNLCWLLGSGLGQKNYGMAKVLR